jgi:hypothetical protein
VGRSLDKKEILFKRVTVRNLEPDDTTVRICLEASAAEARTKKVFSIKNLRGHGIDPACDPNSQGSQYGIKGIARRDVIHERVVSLIEESLPNAFITMEAVRASRTKRTTHHPIYGRIQPGIRLHP